jgi:phenylacetate-CoA ligase
VIWNPEYESMKRADLEELQLSRLQSTVASVHERVPYYRAALERCGVRPGDI